MQYLPLNAQYFELSDPLLIQSVAILDLPALCPINREVSIFCLA